MAGFLESLSKMVDSVAEVVAPRSGSSQKKEPATAAPRIAMYDHMTGSQTAGASQAGGSGLPPAGSAAVGQAMQGGMPPAFQQQPSGATSHSQVRMMQPQQLPRGLRRQRRGQRQQRGTYIPANDGFKSTAGNPALAAEYQTAPDGTGAAGASSAMSPAAHSAAGGAPPPTGAAGPPGGGPSIHPAYQAQGTVASTSSAPPHAPPAPGVFPMPYGGAVSATATSGPAASFSSGAGGATLESSGPGASAGSGTGAGPGPAGLASSAAPAPAGTNGGNPAPGSAAGPGVSSGGHQGVSRAGGSPFKPQGLAGTGPASGGMPPGHAPHAQAQAQAHAQAQAQGLTGSPAQQGSAPLASPFQSPAGAGGGPSRGRRGRASRRGGRYVAAPSNGY